MSRDLRGLYGERRQVGEPWLLIPLLILATGILSYALSSGGNGPATPSSSTWQQPAIYETVAVTWLTASAPKPTTVPKPTPTPKIVIVTVTPTATSQMDYCDAVGNETPCALPPAPKWTETPLPICWVEVTPNPKSITMCQKRDEFGTAREESTK